MKKDTKSTKAQVVEALTKTQSEYLDSVIGYQLEVINMDNVYNKDRAVLVKLLVENVSLALGTEPSYALWNTCHNHVSYGVCQATGMDSKSFDNNIWSNITKRLESDYALVKPKSPNVKSEQKSEQRAKIDAMTDQELKDAGKLVELARREENRLKQENQTAKKAHTKFIKEFSDKMKDLAKTEYDFAMYLENNLNTYREQFKKQK